MSVIQSLQTANRLWQRRSLAKALLAGLVGLSGTAAWAQTEAGAEAAPATASLWDDPYFVIVISVSLLLVFVVVLLAFVTVIVLNHYSKVKLGKGFLPETQPKEELEALPVEERAGFLARAWGALVGARGSISQKGDRKLDEPLGHSYDGIEEFDNSAPPIFNYILYGTFIFAVVYLTYFHILGGPSQREEFETNMVEAEAKRQAYLATQTSQVDENTITLNLEQATLAAGKELYVGNCAACHGTNGEGGIGTNFTDNAWLHGCSIQDVFKSVKYGWPAAGMKAWEAELTPREMAQVSNYVLSLQGTELPAGIEGKEAQGEVCDGAATPEIDGETANAPSDTTVAQVPDPDEPAPRDLTIAD